MSGSTLPKPRPSRVADGPKQDVTKNSQAVELSILRQRLLERRRPGAASAIRRMERLDKPIADLRSSVAKLKLNTVNDTGSIDPMLKRLIFIKTNDLLTHLVEIVQQVANVNNILELTAENTHLEPEDPELTKAYEEVCRGIYDDVQYDKMRCDHAGKVMFDGLDFLVDLHLKGHLIRLE